MRALNVIGAFTVMMCNLIVSYNHSIELFISGGFHGWMAHMAVVGCETTFLLGALNLVVSRMKGEPPGSPAILGGLLGVALVSWSNVAAGWSYGVVGILLGLATPASLLVAEGILSRAILQRVKRKPMEANASIDKLEGAPTPATVENAPTVSKEEVETSSRRDKSSKLEAATSPRKTKSSKVRVEDRLEEPSSSPASTTREERVENTTTHQKMEASNQKKVPRKVVVEKALEILEREGELPGRPRLVKETGCKDWIARKVVQDLRKELKEERVG